MSGRCIVVGAGGHARVLLKTLLRLEFEIVGLVDADSALWGRSIAGVPVLGGDEALTGIDRGVALVNGIGSTRDMTLRRSVHRRLSGLGFRFATVVHPVAFCEDDVVIGAGAQVMAGAVVQTGCRIGDNTIVNTSASIDHDCSIGAHCHVGPGTVLSGGVTIADDVHVGTGTTVIQNVTVGSGCLIAAGSVVTSSLPPGARVAGVPARPI